MPFKKYWAHPRDLKKEKNLRNMSLTNLLMSQNICSTLIKMCDIQLAWKNVCNRHATQHKNHGKDMIKT